MEGAGKVNRRDFIKGAAMGTVGSLMSEHALGAELAEQGIDQAERFDSTLFEEIVAIRNLVENNNKGVFAQKIESKMEEGIERAKADQVTAFDDYLHERSPQKAMENALPYVVGGGATAAAGNLILSEKPNPVKAGSIGALGGAALSFLSDRLLLDKDSKELTAEERDKLRKEYAHELERVKLLATQDSIALSNQLASSRDLKKEALVLEKRIFVLDEQFPQYAYESPLVKCGIVLFLSSFRNPNRKVEVP